jgi:hypothetical protein
MKKLLIFLFSIIFYNLNGQSFEIKPNGLQNVKIKTDASGQFNHTSGNVSWGTQVNSLVAYIQTNTNHNLEFKTPYVFGLNITTACDVESTTYVKFGTDATPILPFRITGFTNSLDGARSYFTTNFPKSKVLEASIVIDCGAAGYVSNNYKYSNGYQVVVQIEDNAVSVDNILGNSYNITGKPFKLNIIYKQ